MSNLAQIIELELARAAEKDQLDLPSLQAVALRIRETASNPNVLGRAQANVIFEDPSCLLSCFAWPTPPCFVR